MTDNVQYIAINRDLEFSIYFKDAAGAAIDQTGRQYLVRIFSKPGTVALDLTWGAGVSLGDAPTGRIDVAVVAASMGLTASSGASGEIVRTDTGADVYGTWPIRICAEGEVPPSYCNGVVTIQTRADIVITAANAPAGPQGAPGAAGGASAAMALPLLPNGGFEMWGKGTGPFTADGVVAEGVRLLRGSGSTHAVSRAAGIVHNSLFSMSWQRSVAGSAFSYLGWRVPDVEILSGLTVTIGFDALADIATALQVLVSQNFGTGGSAATNTLSSSIAIGTGVGRKTATIAIPSAAGKTIGTDSFTGIWFRWDSAQANATIKLDDVSLHIGSADMGYVRPPQAIEETHAGYQFQTVNFQAVNGTQWIQFPIRMRAAPTLSLGGIGSANNITRSGFNHTHTASAAVTATADCHL